MLKFPFFLIVLLCSAVAFSDGGIYHISGKVVDAESGEPIKVFRIDRKMGKLEDKQARWHEFSMHCTFPEDKPGEYLINCTTSPAPDSYLRFVARGYEPFVSRKILPNEGPITIDGRLKRRLAADGTAEIRGRVLTPGKRPATWATVGVAKSGQSSNIWVNNGQIGGNGASATTEVDEDGSFFFDLELFDMKPDEPYCIVFAHETGFAEFDGADFDATHRQLGEKQGEPVVLVPWGRVEGTVAISGRLWSDAEVELGLDGLRSSKNKQWDGPRVSYSCRTRTDTQGQFVFPRVPPKKGEAHVSETFAVYRRGNQGGSRIVKLLEAAVTVEPGKVTTITLGGTGRPVIGRLEFPEDLPPEVNADWKNASVTVSFQASEQSPVTTCGTTVNPDGTFRIVDVPPGRGTLRARLCAPSGGPQIGYVEIEIDVPAFSDGEVKSTEPLNLGTVKLQPQRKK